MNALDSHGQRLGGLAAVIVASVWLLPQSAPALGQTDMTKNDLLAQAMKASQSDDLDAIEQIASTLHSTYSPSDPAGYAESMVELCHLIQSMVSRNPYRQHVLLRRYVEELLETTDPSAMERQASTLDYLLVDTAYSQSLDGGAWMSWRESNARLGLDLCRRFELMIDPNFDPEDRPSANVMPPKGSGVSAGADPEEIEDTALREAYERDIAANREKANVYKMQTLVQRVARTTRRQVMRYLERAYAREPRADEEVLALMTEYGVDPDLQQMILSKLQE